MQAPRVVFHLHYGSNMSGLVYTESDGYLSETDFRSQNDDVEEWTIRAESVEGAKVDSVAEIGVL